jgi:hypothetical protein
MDSPPPPALYKFLTPTPRRGPLGAPGAGPALPESAHSWLSQLPVPLPQRAARHLHESWRFEYGAAPPGILRRSRDHDRSAPRIETGRYLSQNERHHCIKHTPCSIFLDLITNCRVSVLRCVTMNGRTPTRYQKG